MLVTAADTLIGSRTLNQLLAYDVSVRAIVGSQEQVNFLRQQYPSTRYPWLEIAIVPRSRLATPGAFDDALRDHPEPFDTIIHTVTDHSEEADCLSRFINIQTECLLNILRSINMINARVRRVVINTSLSPFARWLVEPDSGPHNPYNPTSHRTSEVDPEYILATSQASDNIVYTALWNWIREARARFELVYVTAPSVYGPQMQYLENSSDLQEANRRVWNICGSESYERLRAPPYGIEHYTDVRVSLIYLWVESKKVTSTYKISGLRCCKCPGSFRSTSGKQKVYGISGSDVIRCCHRAGSCRSVSRTCWTSAIRYPAFKTTVNWSLSGRPCRHTAHKYNSRPQTVPEGRGHVGWYR
jgi:hypothetical protein